MRWSEFYSLILPLVPGAPEPLVDEHLREAAREFCSKTCCWQVTLDAVTTSGADLPVVLPLEEGMELVKLLVVRVGDLGYTIGGRRQGLSYKRRGSAYSRFAWTDNRQELSLWPVPDAGLVLTVDCAVKPSEDSDDFDDDLALHHRRDIAAGALAELLDLPQTAWANPAKAATERQKFLSAIGTVTFTTARGHGPRLHRNPPPTF